jgi:tyrosyl-tRNA synthetase
MLQGEDAANQGQAHFENTFQKGLTPNDILEVEVSSPTSITELVVDNNLAPSKSQFRRLVDQNAVKIDSQVVSDPNLELTPADSGEIIQVGKRSFIKIK